MPYVFKFLDIMAKLLKVILGINMLVTLALIFINVFLRTFFNNSIDWVEPAVIYLIMWTVFLGVGLVYSGDEHLTMGLIHDFASDRWKKILDVINILIITVVSLFLIYYGYIVTKNLHMLGQKSLDGTIPLYLIMMSIPIGTIVALIMMYGELLKSKFQPAEGGANQ